MPKVKCICQVCGKEFEVKPYRANTAKFCNYDCYWVYKSLYCVGEKNHFYGKKHTKKSKKLMSELRLKQQKAHDFSRGMNALFLPTDNLM